MAKDGHLDKQGRVFWIKDYRGGKPYYESTKSEKESETKRLLRKRLGQIAEGRFFGLRPERVKFEDLARDFLNDYRINGKRSIEKAERGVRHLQHFFGGMRAVKITTDKVRTYISDRLDDSVSSAEIDRELAALKRMFNLALQQTPPKEEVLALTWDRVDLRARMVRLDPETTKNDDGRLINLSQATKPAPCSIAAISSATATCERPPSGRRAILNKKW